MQPPSENPQHSRTPLKRKLAGSKVPMSAFDSSVCFGSGFRNTPAPERSTRTLHAVVLGGDVITGYSGSLPLFLAGKSSPCAEVMVQVGLSTRGREDGPEDIHAALFRTLKCTYSALGAPKSAWLHLRQEKRDTNIKETRKHAETGKEAFAELM